MKPPVQHVWWHGKCGAEVAQRDYPETCPRCGDENTQVVFEDLGWRVGFNPQTYSWYSTHERALTDGRLK